MLERLDKAPADLRRDGERAETVRRVEAERAKLVAALPSGERGSVYLRLREKTVFALQMGALQLAGVTPGDWRAHLAFVCPGLACP